ncbi:hypothetical protein AABM26_13665 [Curtobacterium aetherium]|uniref:hypothetical protein n=1 Tax=Curtobacterium aetherium TaxID=2841594 RepID=UPI003B52A170
MTDPTTADGAALPADTTDANGPAWTDDALLVVEAAVLAVPGVADLYRARPTIGSAVAAVRRLGSAEAGPRIVADGSVLRLVIGTDGAAPAPGVARAVHDAVLAEAAASGRTPTRIDVRVARVG